MQKDKKGTSRITLNKDLNTPNIFTLESSFCGPDCEEVHFGVNDFELIGKKIC